MMTKILLMVKCLILLATVWLCYGFTPSNDKTSLCTEISSFFPNMCQYDIIKTKCNKTCTEGKDPGANLTCGRRSAYQKRFKRIVGGVKSDNGQWPWHVSLHLNGVHTCGATILSPRFVITAAHCLDNEYTSDKPKEFSVVAGTNRHSEPYQKVRVQTFVKHFGYNVSFHEREDLYFVYVRNDIAIIKLEEKLDLSIHNQEAVCLPDNFNPIPISYQCYIVGYGMTVFQGEKSSYLRHANIDTVPIEECNKPESFNKTINSNMTICGGDGTPSVSPCNFDSGGGLVCRKDGRWYISGIVSSGFKCGGKNAYSMYTNVAKYEDWVAKTLFTLDKYNPANGSNNIRLSILLQYLTLLLVIFIVKDLLRE